jgi:outer membrane protein insertion porin family
MVEYRHFFPDRLISKGRNTFGYRFLGEYIRAFDDSAIPFFERFFIGGETTLRGFDIRSISPLAISSTPAKDSLGNPVIDLNTGLPRIDRNITPIGGDTLAMFNGEYRIPIAGPLSMAAFYDVGFSRVSSLNNIGNLGNTSIDLIEATNNVIRGSSGVEIQFLLPVVSAPFRLIFAFNPHTFNDVIMVGTTPLQIREPRRDIKFTIGRSF